MQILKKIVFFIFLLTPTVSAGIYAYAFSPILTQIPTSPNDNQEILPTDSFVIEFDDPVDKTYYQNNIFLSPSTPMTATINDAHTAITITPKKSWSVDQKYSISIPKGRTKKYTQVQGVSFAFSTTKLPQVIDTAPQNHSVDIRLDIEEPITIQFDKSTKGFFVDFAFDPPVPLEFRNNARKTQFDLLPKEKLSHNTSYTLLIRAKAKNAPDSTYQNIHSLSFTTIPPKPKTWAEKLNDRLIEAKRFTEAQIINGKYIDVNLSSQIMTLFENGKVIDAFLISSGKPGMATPRGSHQIYNKHPRPWSKKYSLFMPYWMAITSDGKYGIHELPEWPGGYKEGQNHLGIPVSHGCMRLGVGPAKTVYNWADIGTPVIVH